jgi:hypothetical protein
MAVLLLVLTGCGGQSKNATACKLFEDGYNQLTDAVRAKMPAAEVISERDALPSRVRDAENKAEGDVAVAIRNSRELASGLASGNDDAGTAFFLSTTTVADKCKADGAAIDLHPTS